MTNGIIIIGAGGHAKVCIELLRSMQEQVAYCVGDDASTRTCLDVPVLAGDENLLHLRNRGYSRAFVAVGSNRLRLRLAETAQTLGYTLVNAVSPRAVISPSATIGRGVAIMAGVVVNADAVVSDLAIVNTGATIDHDCRIGYAAHIGPQCGLAGGVSVGRGSFLGIGCKVIPEIVIGDDVIIGAGGVVIADVEGGTTAVGVPARILESSRHEAKR